MDKNELLKPTDLEQVAYSVPGKGEIMLRAITRQEAVEVSNAKTTSEREIRMLHAALAKPELTRGECEQWMRTESAGVIQNILEVIGKLSGLAPTPEEQRELMARFLEQ